VNLARTSVNKPVTTAMIYIAMIVLGLASLMKLGIDLMPEMEIPAVSVLTAYEGAGPEEIETLITEPMEDSLSAISGVDEVISISKEGLSSVVLKFKWGQKIDEIINDVRDKVDQAKPRLPDDAENPSIIKFDIAMSPILIISITADDSYPVLEKIVKDEIVDPLKRVKGVAAATPRGGLERQIRVDIDRDRLAALNLSVAQINTSLAAQNISVPGGNIKMGDKDYLLRTPEEFSSAKEVAEVVIAGRNGMPVKLKDVADVRDFYKERTYDVRINGRRGMAVFILKQSGENTVDVARRVAEELGRIRGNLPPDVVVRVVMDNSEFIIASVNNLRDTIIWAIFFVFLVLLFFLGDLRASLIVATSIPISLIITFLLMWLAGYTINNTSLASLAIAVGMVVDNAIVVVDNISRHRQRGQRSKESAVFGTEEVGMAVVASTLTTVAIFTPIIFVGGIAKVVFGQFAAIVTMALITSLFTALMLVPMLCSKFLKIRNTKTGSSRLNSFYNLGEKTLTGMEQLYLGLLDWALRNRKTVIASCIVLLVWSIGLATFVGTEFFPQEDQNRLMVNYELPIGTRYEQTGLVAQQLQKIAENHVPERRDCFIRWGVLGSSDAAFSMQEESHKGVLFLALKPKKERDASPFEIIERLSKITARIPGATFRFSAEDPLAQMIFGSGGKLAVELYGHNMEDARRYSETVAAAISKVEGVKDVDISRKEEKPEMKVVIDRDKASQMGLSVKDIGKTIETYFAGTTASKYREGGDEYDIEVRLREEDREKVEDLRDVFVITLGGRQVSLANVARIEYGVGPTMVERKDQARYITVSADVRGRDLGSAAKDVEKIMSKISVPPGFSYKFAGEQKEQKETAWLLQIAAILGMILVYMVMAAQFESYRDPFIIFLSVPFGIIGVIISLVVTGQTMNIITYIALILLVGVVVNNGIVLISYTNMLRQRGLGLYEAITEGGRSRLRPILSTTITTLLGVAPLAVFRGEGSEIWVPFAVTIIGGLSLGTFITLILMPVLYSIFEERKQRALEFKQVIK
jgi:HAE1 family hydrophobic/amphiphilic exporter-1